MTKPILTIFFCAFLLGCEDPFVPSFDQESVEGYQPVYQTNMNIISIEEPRDFLIPSNAYIYGDLILIQEQGAGFHIFDNANPQAPVNVGFFQIPLNHNLAIKGNVIYADSGPDLLALEISTDGQISSHRMSGVFEMNGNFNLPPEPDHYFECIDEEQGQVIGWIKTTLNQPQCYY